MALACHDDLQEAESDLNNILMLKEYLEGVAALHSTLVAEGCSSSLGRWLEGQLAPERLATTKEILAIHINDHARSSKRPVDARINRLWAMRVSYVLCLLSFLLFFLLFLSFSLFLVQSNLFLLRPRQTPLSRGPDYHTRMPPMLWMNIRTS